CDRAGHRRAQPAAAPGVARFAEDRDERLALERDGCAVAYAAARHRPPGGAEAMKTFENFSAEHRAAGFDEVLERRWQPDTVIDTHAHSFAVQALVVQGEMWLTVGSRTQHLKAGERFELEPDVPHAERYG